MTTVTIALLRVFWHCNRLTKRLHANAAIALLLQIGHHRRGVGEPERSIKTLESSNCIN